jgi:CBS domain-containing protein
MNLSQFCIGALVSISATATLQEAAELMAARSVGCLIVTSETSPHKKPVGIITDRDIVVRALRERSDLSQQLVGSAMSHRVVSVVQSSTVEQAVQVMLEQRVRRVVIVNDEGEACGFISSDEAVQKLSEQADRLSNQLRALAELTKIQNGTHQRHRTHDFTRMA